MIMVDSSVWIDYFNGTDTDQVKVLDELSGKRDLVIGDLILAEVLQGFRSDRAFATAHQLLRDFPVFTLGGAAIAMQAAANYRLLRKIGVTVRKTIDTIIATSCIEQDIALLYSDRDFDPFVRYLGLRSAMG